MSTAPIFADIDDDFLQSLKSFKGRGADLPGFDAPAPVSEAVVRQMVHAVGDRNPVYTDAAFARASRHGSLVAPPLWLYSWMMAGLGLEDEEAVLADGARVYRAAPGGQRRTAATSPTLRDELNQLLESRGFASPVVTEMNYRFERYLRHGERPRFSSWIIDDIVGPKNTRIGTGFFVTLRLEVFVGAERVASMVQRYLRARPHSGGVAASSGPSAALPRPVEAGEIRAWQPARPTLQTRRFESLAVGDALPEWAVALSPTLIIAGALASQDFQDVHHDFLASARRGHPTVFMNMMTLSGLIGRFVSDWSGPECIVREHTLRLGRPNYAGDVLRIGAHVTELDRLSGPPRARLAFVGHNSLGQAIEGDVLLEWPA